MRPVFWLEYVFINFNTDEATKFSNIKKIDDEIASGKNLNEFWRNFYWDSIGIILLGFASLELWVGKKYMHPNKSQLFPIYAMRLGLYFTQAFSST